MDGAFIHPGDPAEAYARGVISGGIVAGPHVRAACKRFLRDLECGHERGITYHPELTLRVIEFFSICLTVEIEEKNEFGEIESSVVPFKPLPYQCFVLGNLFGFKLQGVRRFRRSYIEVAKGAGKTPLCAGILLYCAIGEEKERAECFAAAADYDQANLVFQDCVAYWRRNDELQDRLKASGNAEIWKLTDPVTGSFIRPVASAKKGKSGARVACAVLDEVHEHADDSVVEMMRAGTKGNQNALIVEITNSGSSRESFCFGEHEYSIKVAKGEVENDSWFAYVAALDEKDDPFKDESCWIKANPGLGSILTYQYVREQVAEAKGIPSKENRVRRLNFCQWTDAVEAWIGREKWESIEADLALDHYAGRVCYGGLDLSFTTDLSALALVFPGDYLDAFVWFFKPQEGLQEAAERDKVNYPLWAKQGHLLLTDGSVIKLGPIADLISDIASRFSLQTIVYDRYRHRELQTQMADQGVEVPMQEHPQGFRRGTEENPLWMPSSVQELENAITERRLRVKVNPVLRWNVSSAVVRQDPAGTDNKVFDKRKSTGRIDGVVALAMAVGAASLVPVSSGAGVEVW